MTSFRAALVLCAIIALADAPVAAGAPYQFTKIADTDSPAPFGSFFEFVSSPAVEGDRVAFTAHYAAGAVEGGGVFIGDGGPLTTVAKSGDVSPLGGTFNELLYQFATALDGGAATFVGISDSGVGLFRGAGGAVSIIAQPGDPAPIGAFTAFSEPAVDDGATAFYGISGGQSGVYVKAGAALTQISRTGDPAPSGAFTGYASPLAMSGGKVAFEGLYPSGSGVFAGAGGPLTTIVKTGDPAPSGTFGPLVGNVAISGDTVAFFATFNGLSGIFTGSGGPLTTIAITGDPAPTGTFTDFNHAAISGDTVAFSASYNGNKFGIFVHSGGAIMPVVSTGDPLFGSVVHNLSIGRLSLDPGGSGNLAFNFTLEDGRWGIALARAVPEPHALWLIGVSALPMARAKRRLSLRGAA